MNARTLFRTLLFTAAAVSSLLAQNNDGSYWNEYPRPANVTNVRGLGSQVLIETPTHYHFYSGQHRRWLVHPVTAPTIIGFANKHTVFRDGTTVYGYSTITAQIAALPTSGSATVSIGSATSSWTAYVVDGTSVWAWSAFFGEWKPLTAAAAPSMGIGSHMVSCNDGVQISAFSAFFGNWVTTPSTGATQVTTWRNGTVAMFSAPDHVAAFSAYTNTWQNAPFPTLGATVDVRDAFASVSNNGADRLFFSALHGEFLPTFWPTGTLTQFGPSCAVVTTPSGVLWGYSPSDSTLTWIPTVATPSVTMALGSFGGCAVIDDGVTLQAFSGYTGTVAAAPFYVPTTITIGDTAAFATGPSGNNFAYSAIRGEWVTAPTAIASDTRANYECILRTVPGGFEAFSARTGTFATLASSGNIVNLAQGSIIGIVDGAGIDVFDPRYCRWERTNTGPSPTFGVHRLVGIGQDGANAYGFSLWANAWESVPLQGAFVAVNVNSSIGYVTTSTHYYVYTATGSMSTFARFPEFSRFHALGQPLTHFNAGNPGAFVLSALSLTETEATTPFGVLRVDPNPIVAALGFVPPNGLLFTPISTPDVPALRGIEIFMQDVILRPSGQIALSNGLAHYLW
ncbi:MAG: hypothetical protein WAT39_00505 [Planctomycetota bacterium]